MGEWIYEKSSFFESRFRRYEKKHPMEALAALNNLHTYMSALNEGINPLQISGGFIHDEGRGIKALDQKGGKGKLHQTRLYVYPDEKTKKLHLITIGDKNGQSLDVQDCKVYIEPLKG